MEIENVINVIKNTALAKGGNNSTDSLLSYEVALPIVFIVLFLVMLVMTYFVREVVVKKKKFCFSKTRNHPHYASRNTSFPANGNADYSQIRITANYNKPVQKLNESCQYFEEPRAGFYHVQKLNSFNRNYIGLFKGHGSYHKHFWEKHINDFYKNNTINY